MRAVDTLRPLGSGYAVIDLGSRRAIQSLPLELSPDGSKLVAEGEPRGYFDRESACRTLVWQPERFDRAVVQPCAVVCCNPRCSVR